MGIPKMCLKQGFSYCKWALQAILSLTVFSNWVSGSSNFHTTFRPDFTWFCSVYFMSLDRKFNGDSKNVLKTVIFFLEVGFTGDFVPDCLFKLDFWQFTPLFSLTLYDFVIFFSVYRLEI